MNTPLKNVHVLDFKNRPHTKNKTRTQPPSFNNLALKLEDKINNIEKDLRESMQLLEVDVHKIIKTTKNKSEIKEDIDNLSKQLETRVNQSLTKLINTSKSRYDQDEIKLIKNLSSQLVKILSFDFYKNIFARLQKEDSETEVDEFGMDHRVINKIKPLVNFLYYKYWRVQTTGISNIPNTGRALVVSNHSGTLPYDGSMLAAAIYNEHPIRKDARFLVEDFVFHMPMLGSLMYRIGGVRACPENAERLLSKDHLVIVFPEGVKGIGKYYNQRYKLQRFGRGGFIKLCLQTKSPLIPVGIVGAEEIHPIIYKSNTLAKTIGVPYLPITPTFPLLGLLGIIPFPSRWSIHFGTPIPFDAYADETLGDDLTIHKLSENVRDKIQVILMELLKKRRSVWLG
ncbi:MAG: 1-acyl-sn-glycerol-3-phosphate acyltransferase [Deltaproteobacteria bacterium]|nr:1-acyl-sn-glycerol-3-phosphate acyltransferase [Deltaproteobacteria bacterium]